MAALGRIGRRLRMLARRRRADRDLDDELQLHLELIEKRQRDAGVPAAEARLAARRRFGNPDRIREATRDARGWRWLEDLAQDLRYAVRSLGKNKAFAATAVLTLALGIGANTAIFSVVNGVVFRPLPFPQPDRLVQMYGTPAARGEAVRNLDEYRRQSTSFEALAGCEVGARYLRGSNGSERVMTVTAERGLFEVLGVAPIAGRTFRSDDSASVAVVSHGFWKERLGGNPSAIGMSVSFDGDPFTIIGVMPNSFQFPYGAASLLPGAVSQARTDFWIPVDPPVRQQSRIGNVTGRLKAGVTLSAAESELAVIARRLEAQYPDTNKGLGVRLVPLSEGVVAKSVRRPLFILFGAVGLVLALACANVMNLSLVRMTLRSREVAMRAALGASPSRLVRQFLTESLFLSLAGGVLGLGLAWWGTNRMLVLAGTQLPRSHEVGLDWRVYLFLLAACVLTGIIFGLAPAFIAGSTDTQSVLQETGGHTTMGGTSRRLRDGIVVAEVALGFVLAVGATLLIRELVRLRNTDSGIVSRNVVTIHLGQRTSPRTDARQYDEIADRVARLPGIRAAGFTQLLPLQNWGWTANLSDFIRGRAATQAPSFGVELRYVTPGYFRAFGIPIRKGRSFTARDTRDLPKVILINEALARRYFENEDPVGKETTRGTIVGVVGDVRQVNLDKGASPEIYYPIAQNWGQLSELGMTLVVSTQNRPEASIDAIRSVIRDVNSNQAIFNIRTMDRVIADSLSDFTLYLSLMGSFAVLALILTSIGTYGVTSYVATSRMREFAIRVALGADKAQVSNLVLGQGLRLTGIGLGFGLVGALAATPLLQNLPVTVRPPDVVTLAPVVMLISIVALAACLAPARRAANADPMNALRNE